MRTGLDVLIEDHLHFLDGKKIGLVTNHSGLTRTGIKNYAFFQKSAKIELSVIFAPGLAVAVGVAVVPASWAAFLSAGV